MEKYELTFIVEEKSSADLVKKIFEEKSVSVTKEQDLSVREFAYPIKKATRGHYFCFHFETEGKNLADLEKAIKAEKKIIRYLIVKALRADQTVTTKPLKREVSKPKGTPSNVPELSLTPVQKAPKVEPEEKIEKVEVKAEPVKAEPAKVEQAPKDEPKKAPVAEAKKPATKPKRKITKAPKIEASELDKKLKELVEE